MMYGYGPNRVSGSISVAHGTTIFAQPREGLQTGCKEFDFSKQHHRSS